MPVSSRFAGGVVYSIPAREQPATAFAVLADASGVAVAVDCDGLITSLPVVPQLPATPPGPGVGRSLLPSPPSLSLPSHLSKCSGPEGRAGGPDRCSSRRRRGRPGRPGSPARGAYRRDGAVRIARFGVVYARSSRRAPRLRSETTTAAWIDRAIDPNPPVNQSPQLSENP